MLIPLGGVIDVLAGRGRSMGGNDWGGVVGAVIGRRGGRVLVDDEDERRWARTDSPGVDDRVEEAVREKIGGKVVLPLSGRVRNGCLAVAGSERDWSGGRVLGKGGWIGPETDRFRLSAG